MSRPGSRLEDALRAAPPGGGGSILLVGDAGSGKSRILRELQAEPPRGLRAVYVPIPSLDFGDLAAWCVSSLGGGSRADPATAFAALIDQAVDGVLLLVDDADHLPLETASDVAESVARSEGRLVVVACACPGVRADELAQQLRVSHRIRLGREREPVLPTAEVRAAVSEGSPRAPMARIPPAAHPPRLSAAPPPPPALVTPIHRTEVRPVEAEIAEVPGPPEPPQRPPGALPAPAPSAKPRPGSANPIRGPRVHARHAKWLTLVLAGGLLLAGAYELGRRSAAAPSPALAALPAVSAGSVDAAPQAAALAKESASTPAPIPPPEAPTAVASTPVMASADASAVVAAEAASPAAEQPSRPIAPIGPAGSGTSERPLAESAGRARDAEPAPIAAPSENPVYATAIEMPRIAPTLRVEPPAAAPRPAPPEDLDLALLHPSVARRVLPAPAHAESEFAPIFPTLSRRALPPPRHGWLEVEVEGGPRGLVWIDGVSAGATPVKRVGVAPGRHRVTLRTANGARVSRTVEVRAERGTRLRVELD